MSARKATGTKFKEHEEKRAKQARKEAQLWKLVKSAIRAVDASRVVGRGVYEIPPELMVALRHQCDELRFPLKMQELEMKKNESEEEDVDE